MQRHLLQLFRCGADVHSQIDTVVRPGVRITGSPFSRERRVRFGGCSDAKNLADCR